MTDFLTVEDINSILFSNQGFYFWEIDLKQIPVYPQDFDWIKIDFCEIKKNGNIISVRIYHSKWTKGALFVTSGGFANLNMSAITDGFSINIEGSALNKILLYMGDIKFDSLSTMTGQLLDKSMDLNSKQLKSNVSIKYRLSYTAPPATISKMVEVGYNEIIAYNRRVGFLLVNLVKSDFEFSCNQNLVLGKVNKVALGTNSDYLPNGDMVGEYTPNIQVLYENNYIPVAFDTNENDYCFNIDLTNQNDLTKIKFKVNIESNKVLNHTITEVTLPVEIETITTTEQLTRLFTNGGIGRLGANITLTNNLTVKENVYLQGENHTLDLNNHSIIIEPHFKTDEVIFTNGEYALIQIPNSTLELTECTFAECTTTINYPYGSCIYCTIDLESLENPTDFHTIIKECNFNNCTSNMILHGGELEITKSNISINDITILETGTNDTYTMTPFFLYQTDGEANISNTICRLEEMNSDNDLGFAPALFCCGENAIVNGLAYTELQNNNITSFLNGNHISIDGLTYYYAPIEDNITLTASNGFCHCVSGVDYLFKTNVLINRSG